MAERIGRGESVLVVDDSTDTLEVLRRNLEDAGFRVRCATGVDPAIAELARAPSDVVVTDLRMPGRSGLDLIRHVRENLPDTEVLMVTGFPSVDTAIAALKSGADDYLAKPFTSQELLAAVWRALDKLAARRGATSFPPRGPEGRFGLVGACPPMRAAFEALARAAATDAPVVFLGEPGTGRQALARALHAAGPRAAHPFVVVACDAAGPHDLARASAEAGAGTLFLENVDRAAPAAPPATAARLVASATIEPATLVARGLLDPRLAGPLSGARIVVPALRDRGAAELDALLATYLPPQAGATLTERARAALAAHAWPGNLDELRATCSVLAARGGAIDAGDLPPAFRVPAGGGDGIARTLAGVERTLAEVERVHIRAVLSAVGGNRSKAAEILGIHRKTLREKLKT